MKPRNLDELIAYLDRHPDLMARRTSDITTLDGAFRPAPSESTAVTFDRLSKCGNFIKFLNEGLLWIGGLETTGPWEEDKDHGISFDDDGFTHKVFGLVTRVDYYRKATR